MTRLGHAVTLVAPDVRGTVLKDPRSYYGLRESFAVVRLPVFDGLRSGWVPGALAFFFTMRSYAHALRSFLHAHPADILYTRSPVLLPSLLQTDMPVILELHTLPRRTSVFVRRCNQCSRVVCLTAPMLDALIAWGVDASRVVTEGDGVDLRRFEHLPACADARAEWRLPSDRSIAVYVGSLVTRGTIEKGVRELLQAIVLLNLGGQPFGCAPVHGLEWQGREGKRARGQEVFGWVIGGPREKIEEYRAYAEKIGLTDDDVRFEGPVPNARVPSALAAADVCVYPAPASRHPFFLRDTSPLKVFEYLASGKPTVCADLPPLKGVIDSALVHFCPPGDAAALARAITEALQDPHVDEEKRSALLAHTSWDARMERILSSFCPA